MRKLILYVILIGLLSVLTLLPAQDKPKVVAPQLPVTVEPIPKQVRYWQDSLIKPNQQWINVYRYDDMSLIAYNINILINSNQQHARIIDALRKNAIELEKRIDELEKLIDPNVIDAEAKDPNKETE